MGNYTVCFNRQAFSFVATPKATLPTMAKRKQQLSQLSIFTASASYLEQHRSNTVGAMPSIEPYDSRARRRPTCDKNRTAFTTRSEPSTMTFDGATRIIDHVLMHERLSVKYISALNV